jgi:hypothetical protein
MLLVAACFVSIALLRFSLFKVLPVAALLALVLAWKKQL